MQVSFYETARGKSPVTDFIDKQSKKEQAVLLAVIQNITQFSYKAKGCKFKHLENKLWEIKIKTPNGGYRLLYVTLEHSVLFILHMFKKKSQKTPKKELDIAKKRAKEIL